MYDMFTDEGNEAVYLAIKEIRKLSEDHAKVWNQDTLESVAVSVIAEVAKEHEEVYDTEPRGYIGDALAKICEANGWAWDRWNSNFW